MAEEGTIRTARRSLQSGDFFSVGGIEYRVVGWYTGAGAYSEMFTSAVIVGHHPLRTYQRWVSHERGQLYTLRDTLGDTTMMDLVCDAFHKYDRKLA